MAVDIELRQLIGGLGDACKSTDRGQTTTNSTPAAIEITSFLTNQTTRHHVVRY